VRRTSWRAPGWFRERPPAGVRRGGGLGTALRVSRRSGTTGGLPAQQLAWRVL